MKIETLGFLQCVAVSQNIRCHGKLQFKDSSKLVCRTCDTEYPIKNDIPYLVLGEDFDSRYLDPSMIRSYYEMQFAPYIQ